MAKAKMKPVMENVSGAIGDLVFRNVGGKTVVGASPIRRERLRPKGSASGRNTSAKAHFTQKVPLLTPRVAPSTTSRLKRRHTCAFPAVGDLNPPSVDLVDLSGYTGNASEKIVIRASDDIEVATIRDGKGRGGAGECRPRIRLVALHGASDRGDRRWFDIDRRDRRGSPRSCKTPKTKVIG